MIVIKRPRNKGKTTILLHYMVIDPLAIYVARTEKCAEQAFKISQDLELNLDRSHFVGMTNTLIKDWHEHGYKILIDNADYIIDNVGGWNLLPIAYMITVTN